MILAHAERQKRSAKSSNFKEDYNALSLSRSYYSMGAHLSFSSIIIIIIYLYIIIYIPVLFVFVNSSRRNGTKETAPQH